MFVDRSGSRQEHNTLLIAQRNIVRLNICFALLACVFATGSVVEASSKKLSVKIKLEKCSKTSGGMYREGPPEMPICNLTSGRFMVLAGCKNKYDERTCKFVQKRTSKTGNYPMRLSKGMYHFVWDSTSPELRIQRPCSLRIDSTYDVEVHKDRQEILLKVDEHCSAP